MAVDWEMQARMTQAIMDFWAETLILKFDAEITRELEEIERRKGKYTLEELLEEYPQQSGAEK